MQIKNICGSVLFFLAGCVALEKMGDHHRGGWYQVHKEGNAIVSASFILPANGRVEKDKCFECGGEVLNDAIVQSYYIVEGGDDDDRHDIPSISKDATALWLLGDFRHFPQGSFKNIRALSWEIEYFPSDCSRQDKKDMTLSMNMRMRRRLAELSIFPKLKYLSLRFPSCISDETSKSGDVYQLDLSALPVFKELECLEMVGVGTLIVGFNSYVSKLTKLKSLTVRGIVPNWMPDNESEMDDVVMVNSTAYLGDLPIEKFSMPGALLLQQESLRMLTRVKKMTPPRYYRLADISKSVENLDMTCSCRPLDGFDGLSLFPSLKEVRIFKSDEKDVRKVLGERRVKIEISEECHDEDLRN